MTLSTRAYRKDKILTPRSSSKIYKVSFTFKLKISVNPGDQRRMTLSPLKLTSTIQRILYSALIRYHLWSTISYKQLELSWCPNTFELKTA